MAPHARSAELRDPQVAVRAHGEAVRVVRQLVEDDGPGLVVVERVRPVRVARHRAGEGVDVVDRAAVGRERDAVREPDALAQGLDHPIRRDAQQHLVASLGAEREAADDEPPLRDRPMPSLSRTLACDRREGRARTRRSPSDEMVASPRAAATSRPPSSARAIGPGGLAEFEGGDVDDASRPRGGRTAPGPPRCRPSARARRDHPRGCPPRARSRPRSPRCPHLP